MARPRKPRADAFDVPAVPPPVKAKLSAAEPAEDVKMRFAGVSKDERTETTGGRLGRPQKRPKDAKKLLVYLSPEMYADLKAGATRYGTTMTALIEGLIETWSKKHRSELDATRKALREASPGQPW